MKSMRVGWLAAGLLLGSMSAQAANVEIGGRVWRQVTETQNLSWNDIAAHCNTATGQCGGAHDGWTWASKKEVSDLFEALLTSKWWPNGTEYVSNNDPEFKLFVFNAFGPGMFEPTYVPNNSPDGYLSAWGLTREFNYYFRANMAFLVSYPGADEDSEAKIAASGPDLSEREPSVGHWMYQTASPVPLPASAYLFTSGLVGLVGVARRRSGKTADV